MELKCPHCHEAISILVERKKAKRVVCDVIQPDFDKRVWTGITPGDCAVWSKCYPAISVNLELMRALEWLMANPTKLKKNYRKFLTGWFSRSQERGGGSKSNGCYSDAGEILI